MREATNCPYRVRNTERPGAHCNFLVEAAGIHSNTELADVDNEFCTYCCEQFEPRGHNLNPAVASLLFKITERIIKAEGIGSCSARKASELQELSIAHLEIADSEGDSPEHYIQRKGPCFYQGDFVRFRQCEGCQGNVKLKEFECFHESHHSAFTSHCRKCREYEAPLTATGVVNWAVAITSSPRSSQTLEQSLKSLTASGWSNYHLFVEPGTVIPSDVCDTQVTLRRNQLGAFPNFYTALTEMVMTNPHVDAYMMCQDDVIYCSGLRDYLEENLWPARRLGVVSLHTACHQDRGGVNGFFSDDLGWGAWGAQAYVFPNASARAFLRNARVLNHRHRGPREGKCNVDSVVGQWCRDSGLDYYLHTPSLTQHIGETSTLWPTAKIKGRRRAATFIGESKDINEVMKVSSQSSVCEGANASLKVDLWAKASLAIVSVSIGRARSFQRWLNWLHTCEVPPHCSVYVIDNSGDGRFGRKLRNEFELISDSNRFRAANLHMGPGLAQDRGLSRAKVQNIADVTNQYLEKIREDYVLILDDDVIPPPEGIKQLFKVLVDAGSNCAMVSGAYESANKPGYLTASYSNHGWNARPPVTNPDDLVEEVGYVGTGFLLISNDVLASLLPLRSSGKRGLLGMDNYLCEEVRRKGFKILLHKGVRCDHLFENEV